MQSGPICLSVFNSYNLIYIPYTSDTHTKLLAICSFLCVFLCSVQIPSAHYLLNEQPNEWIYKNKFTVLNYPMFCLNLKKKKKENSIEFSWISPDGAQIDSCWFLLPVHMFLEINMWISKLTWPFGLQRLLQQTWLTTTSDLPLAILFPSPYHLCWCEGGTHVLKWVIFISS